MKTWKLRLLVLWIFYYFFNFTWNPTLSRFVKEIFNINEGIKNIIESSLCMYFFQLSKLFELIFATLLNPKLGVGVPKYTLNVIKLERSNNCVYRGTTL